MLPPCLSFPACPLPTLKKDSGRSIPRTMGIMLIHHRPAPTILHPIAENQRSIPSERDSFLALILPVVVHEDDVERMEVTWDEAEQSEQYVEKYICTTACYEKDS